MHDHATDGGLALYHDRASAREVRLHLDNSHDLRTSGWPHGQLVRHHEALHVEAAERLDEIEAAANLIAEGLASAPPAVIESIVGDRSLYLTDATGIVYLAEPVVGARPHAPVYTLTEQESPAERVVDLLDATKASLAASRAYLDAHKSEGPIPSDAPGGGPVPPAVDPLPVPPSSEEAESAPCPAPRPASSGATSPVVDLMASLEASLAAAKANRSES